jgi:hypothetical protein
LLNELNVKRSAFVCALLARFDGVEVELDKPIVLRLNAGDQTSLTPFPRFAPLRPWCAAKVVES